jgi:ABC-type sugar transport system substrate-binding protein
MAKALISALGLGLALVVATPVIAQARPTICYVTFSLAVGYFQDGVAGAKAAADKLGADLVVLDPQADSSRQVTMFEDCIARKANAIIIDPIESGSLGGAIKQAGAAGIPIAALDTPIDSPFVNVQIGIPQRDASREFGQFVAGYIIGAMGGKASIGIMLASTEVQLARRDGFKEALSAVPGAVVTAEGDGRNILEQATAAAENMLTANPSINVIYATGEPQMQGALAAAQSQGRKIAFFTWDEIPGDFKKLLADGTIVGHLRQKPALGGEMAVRFLVDKLNGKPIPAKFSYSPAVITPYNYNQK